jgi:hypothetical protein
VVENDAQQERPRALHHGRSAVTLIINLKEAKTLGVRIPQFGLVRAVQAIE